MNRFLFICLVWFCVGCAASKHKVARSLASALDAPIYKNQFTGLFIIDALTKDTLYDLNSTKYFTPASNTKIITLYTALKALPTKIPALEYVLRNDTLFFKGTGDPSFLHPYIKDSTAFQFLKSQHHLAYYPDNFKDDRYGPGWSWDDYQWYYSPERSAFPFHGNVVLISHQDSLEVHPSYFKDSVQFVEHDRNRKESENTFFFDLERKDTLEVPYKTSTATTKALLESALNKPVHVAQSFPTDSVKTLYGTASDSLYKRLMVESDNFIAEQLLLLAAGQWKDTLNSKLARDFMLENHLQHLPQPPRWVDGSGLSRYNLFTPRYMVYVLQQLRKELPEKRLYAIFPAGGVSGTLAHWYGNDGPPYIYAKSGSLGNNYCLSGYLITKSGKTLIFSFMNNHYMSPTSEVKGHMQALFEYLRDNY